MVIRGIDKALFICNSRPVRRTLFGNPDRNRE